MAQQPNEERVLTELRKFVAPEFVFGVGALELVGGYAVNLGGRNATVVTDAQIVAAGWTGKAVAALEAAGLHCSVFSRVTPNPRTEDVMAGAQHFRSAGSDFLVAIGGGSSIDCAKGIGLVVASDRHIGDFEGVDRIDSPMPPLLCIPTTSAGADVSQFAIFTNREQRRKFAVISKAVVPDLSLVDPACRTTMDPYFCACTGIDTLTHGVEAFLSTGHSPFTDLHALEAVRLVARHLLPAIADPKDPEQCAGMALAGLQAGLAFSNASLGAAHAMSHVLGGWTDRPHGECNALLLEHVIDFNFPAVPRRCAKIAAALGAAVKGMPDERIRTALRDELRRLRREAGITGTLTDLGVRPADIPELARNAMRDACIVTNPRPPSQRDLETIYEHAL